MSVRGKGTLFLIPTNLASPFAANAILPADVIATVRRLDHFIAENAKTARAFLKALDFPRPLQEVAIAELNDAEPDRCIELDQARTLYRDVLDKLGFRDWAFTTDGYVYTESNPCIQVAFLRDRHSRVAG